MSRPTIEASEPGFDAHRRRLTATYRANAFATLLMAGALTLATIIVLASVSLEVAKASPLF